MMLMVGVTSSEGSLVTENYQRVRTSVKRSKGHRFNLSTGVPIGPPQNQLSVTLYFPNEKFPPAMRPVVKLFDQLLL